MWRIKYITHTVLHLSPSFIVSFHIASGRSAAAVALDKAGVVSIREREAGLRSEGKTCLFPGARPHMCSVMSHRGCYRWCRVRLQRVKKILMELRSRMNVTKGLELIDAAAAASLQSCPTLCDPIDGSPPAPPSLGFSRQEHWSGLPFPSPMHESEK